MNRTRTLAAALLALAVVLPALLAFAPKQEDARVRHVVVFKFKPGAAPEQIARVTEAFRGLQKSIPGIVGFEHGVNNSPEGKSLGFEHVYLLTFENAAARDAYLPHPAHKAFGQTLGKEGIFEDAFVVDYTPLP